MEAFYEGNQVPQNSVAPPKIRVVVRKRPLTSKEVRKGDQDTLVIRTGSNLVV